MTQASPGALRPTACPSIQDGPRNFTDCPGGADWGWAGGRRVAVRQAEERNAAAIGVWLGGPSNLQCNIMQRGWNL